MQCEQRDGKTKRDQSLREYKEFQEARAVSWYRYENYKQIMRPLSLFLNVIFARNTESSFAY